MSYTYVIIKNPTGEDFKNLCSRIDKLCPDCERQGGSVMAKVWRGGGNDYFWMLR